MQFRHHLVFALGAVQAGIGIRVASSAAAPAGESAPPADYREFNQPPHDYFQRTPTDRFTRLKGDLESGRLRWGAGDELSFLRGLLGHLGIPEASQMLVFSTTSLQLSRITPSNPRALYFSDDLYLGYIPGGRIELVALDPQLGAVFYIFDIPRGTEPVRVERATRCMNCHAGDDTGHVPGLSIKSVVPGTSGGSLDSFRRGQTGHGIPLPERFGGWYVTGDGGWTNHWGNALGRYVDGELTRVPGRLEGRVDVARYLRPTSNLLPQLVHEHQAGFVNRVVEAAYRARTHLHTDGGELTAEHGREMDAQAEIVTRYLLFSDEAPLPPGGIPGDAEFQAAFLARGPEVGGLTLREFDLRTRLFKHRCSYMITSPVFEGLPGVMKDRVLKRLADALEGRDSAPEGAHLPPEERQAIRRILEATVPGFPPRG